MRLAAAMLNYGAEAQNYFNYRTDSLMNKELTADQLALLEGLGADSFGNYNKADPSKVGAFVASGGFNKMYPTISLEGAFEINYFMAPANAVDGEMKIYFWSEETYNSTNMLTMKNADKTLTMTIKNGMYQAKSFEVAAKDLEQTIYAAIVYQSGGVTYCSGVLAYSIATYCKNPPADATNVANAIAVYSCAAKEYFKN
jgi:hypothetical protein